MSNPQLYRSLILPLDGTAANPSIQVGGGPAANTGTGIYGTINEVDISIAGSKVVGITSAGLNATIVGQTILAFSSSAGAGGSASEAMTVTGLLASDTIISVSQKVKGANSLPLLGFSTLADNSLTCTWSANPGAGAIVLVSVKR